MSVSDTRIRNHEQHFATLVGDALANEIIARMEDHDRFLEQCGLMDLWQSCWHRYQESAQVHWIEKTGEDGEYVRMTVNHQRNIVQHLLVATTGNRPAMEPQSVNVDSRSRAEIKVANGLLDDFMVAKKVERKINRAIEGLLNTGEWFVLPEWDPWLGEMLEVQELPPFADADEDDPPRERPIYAGDIAYTLIPPNDVARDPTVEQWDDQQWVVVRRWVNRFDLIAQYEPDDPEEAQEFRGKVMSLETRTKAQQNDWRCNRIGWDAADADIHSDLVPVYTLYHNPTPAVPRGRVVKVASTTLTLSDQTMTQLEMEQHPVHRASAGDMEGMPYGYSVAFDLLMIHEAMCLLHSIILTNQRAFGVQCIQGPKGSSVSFRELSDGMIFFEYTPIGQSGGKIEPLTLAGTAAEIFKYLESLNRDLEIISGVNSVARGQPDAQLKSGAALALVHSTHLEFQKGLQGAYANIVQDTGTAVMRLFKQHAEEPRTIAIVGKNNRSSLMQVSKKDIAGIDRVKVHLGSHLSRTPAGRLELAQQLIAAGIPLSLEQLLSVYETGQVESLTQGPTSQLDLIQDENEAILAAGQPMLDEQTGQPVMNPMTGQPMINQGPPPAMITDNHVLHIAEHAAASADLMARRSPAVMDAMNAHVMQHINLLMGMDPVMAALLKQPQLGLPAGPPAPDAQAGAGQGDPAAALAAEPGAPGDGVRLPTNPLTGAEYEPGAAPLQ